MGGVDLEAEMIDGGKHGNGYDDQLAGLSSLKECVEAAKARAKRREWESWKMVRLGNVKAKDVTHTSKRTAERDVIRFDELVDRELDKRDMLGERDE